MKFDLDMAIFAFLIMAVLLLVVLIARVFSVSPLAGLVIVGPILAFIIGGLWPRK